MPLRHLAAALVLATLTMPAALAVGEEAYDAIASAEAEVGHTVRYTYEIVHGLFTPPEEGAEEEPAPAPEEQPPAPEGPPAPAEESAAPAPPPAPRREPSSLLAPVQRLLPIPTLDAGPAPVVDLLEITRVVTDPLAPPPPPPGAPARAPAAPAPELEVASVASPEEAITTVALGVAAAAIATAPAAVSLWERLRGLGTAALLYSRIAKERILDHGSRERLLETIRAKPGLAVADLAVASGLPRNTVTYHLRVLERESLVSSTRNGRNRLFFAPGSLEKRGQADALATLRHETTRAMALAIGASPGLDQKALCARMGVSPSLAHWHADRLVASGVVDKRREGRYVRYYPGASFSVLAAHSA